MRLMCTGAAGSNTQRTRLESGSRFGQTGLLNDGLILCRSRQAKDHHLTRGNRLASGTDHSACTSSGALPEFLGSKSRPKAIERLVPFLEVNPVFGRGVPYLYIYIYICMYVCIYINIYIYIYLFMCIYYTQKNSRASSASAPASLAASCSSRSTAVDPNSALWRWALRRAGDESPPASNRGDGETFATDSPQRKRKRKRKTEQIWDSTDSRKVAPNEGELCWELLWRLWSYNANYNGRPEGPVSEGPALWPLGFMTCGALRSSLGWSQCQSCASKFNPACGSFKGERGIS